MALKQQQRPNKVASSTISRDYPQMPTIPQSLIDRFPELSTHAEEQDQWWLKVQANIRGIESDLATIRAKLNA